VVARDATAPFVWFGGGGSGGDILGRTLTFSTFGAGGGGGVGEITGRTMACSADVGRGAGRGAEAVRDSSDDDFLETVEEASLSE